MKHRDKFYIQKGSVSRSHSLLPVTCHGEAWGRGDFPEECVSVPDGGTQTATERGCPPSKKQRTLRTVQVAVMYEGHLKWFYE